MIRKSNPPGVVILSKKGDGDHEFTAEIYAYLAENPEADKSIAVGKLVLGTL